jgi:hypothetical protein
VLCQLIAVIASFGIIEAIVSDCVMPRVTLSVADREHMALKLLALQQNQKMVAIIDLAIKKYLKDQGAYDLTIQSKAISEEEQG